MNPAVEELLAVALALGKAELRRLWSLVGVSEDDSLWAQRSHEFSRGVALPGEDEQIKGAPCTAERCLITGGTTAMEEETGGMVAEQ